MLTLPPTKHTKTATAVVPPPQFTAVVHSKRKQWLTTTKLLPELATIAVVTTDKPDHSTV